MQQSIKIFIPTSSNPCLKFEGDTFRFRDIFRQNGFTWNALNGAWELDFNDKMHRLSNTETQQISHSIIQQVVNDAVKNHINIVYKNNTFHIDNIKNIHNTYPDGTSLPKNHLHKYSNKKYFDSKYQVERLDAIEAEINHNRIEFTGSTYYNREWLKNVFGAKFDSLYKVWYVEYTEHNAHITLNKVKNILADFGVLKMENNANNCNNKAVHTKTKKNKKHKNSSKKSKKKSKTSKKKNKKKSNTTDDAYDTDIRSYFKENGYFLGQFVVANKAPIEYFNQKNTNYNDSDVEML